MKLFASPVFLILSCFMPTWDASAGDGEVRPHYSKRHLGATPRMWMFGSDGVQIYSADGSELVKEIPASKTCHDVPSSTGDVISRCRFSDAVSDGKKYVWSTISRGLPKMEVFSIDTGDLVGSFTTCGNPGDLDYHPLRDEMWIHCSQFSDTEQSHMDVISTLSPSIPLTTSITMHDNTNIRASGRTTVHGSLGDVGYSTVYGEPNLYKIDLSERRVLETINLSTDPKLYGYFDMAYSQKNGHIFLQSQVCCTCGFEGADALECDRYGSQNITVNGQLVEGQCGRHCMGGPADTIGVIEFDPDSGTVVGEHKFVGSGPIDSPFASRDGEYIVLFGANGGKTVEILRAGAPGVKSTVAFEIELDFETALVPDDAVFDDFVFVQGHGINMFMVASSADNKLAIVDLVSGTPEPYYITFKDEPFVGRPRSRQVEHVAGTHYVWVSGPEDEEAYVIDIGSRKVIKTLNAVNVNILRSVVNWDFLSIARAIDSHWSDSGTWEDRLDSGLVESDEGDDTPSNNGNPTGINPSVGSSNAARVATKEDSDNKGMSIAAIVISLIALAAVMVNTIATMSQNKKPVKVTKSTPEKSLDNTDGDVESIDVPPSVN